MQARKIELCVCWYTPPLPFLSYFVEIMLLATSPIRLLYFLSPVCLIFLLLYSFLAPSGESNNSVEFHRQIRLCKSKTTRKLLTFLFLSINTRPRARPKVWSRRSIKDSNKSLILFCLQLSQYLYIHYFPFLFPFFLIALPFIPWIHFMIFVRDDRLRFYGTGSIHLTTGTTIAPGRQQQQHRVDDRR